MTIDADLARLEEIARKLEAQEIPFEETLNLFQEGTALAKKIKEDLDQAKLRIRQTVENAEGVLRLEEFDLG